MCCRIQHFVAFPLLVRTRASVPMSMTLTAWAAVSNEELVPAE